MARPSSSAVVDRRTISRHRYRVSDVSFMREERERFERGFKQESGADEKPRLVRLAPGGGKASRK
jgi:hypothetical protein